ncbi:polysaccharide pyruvyl transferase family protein [Pantoea ananatis]|uniref:polysaccharide pyruvyl transferase family protein n=1 Tax=Pantoea ananas TaxID=553 RepID=UPI000E25E119|nr:polysaccharide pyruvyl transferase family protein [Pantoea ananatis]REE79663.1 polysaccharide pyruvyl transferase WcaK-like protein [Pantoea ananatis]BBL29639.1 hypothetical protein PAFU01_10870 [Pantoea ananatis]
MKVKKYLVVGVPYSDNLGDYAIYDAIQKNLNKKGGEVSTIDISGRRCFAERSLSSRVKMKQRLLAVNNNTARWFFTLTNAMIVSLKSVAFNARMISQSEFIIIGGGNIFSDNYGNFPVKLFFIYFLIKTLKKPYSVLSVGVGGNWSFLAKCIFKEIINKADEVSVRDHRSKALLKEYSIRRNIDVVPDPAVTLGQFYSNTSTEEKGVDVGINVIDWTRIFFSSDLNVKGLQLNYFDIYLHLAIRYLKNQQKVTFYTNGANEDNCYLQRLSEHIFAYDPKLWSQLNFVFVSDYSQLINVISGFTKVVSSRLHSIIIASSFLIPSVGLAWDGKVSSFYHMLNFSKGAIQLDHLNGRSGEEIANLIEDSFIDKQTLREKIDAMGETFANYIKSL